MNQPQLVVLPTPKRGRRTVSEEDQIIEQALTILARRLRKPGVVLGSPAVVREYLRLHSGALEHEVFSVLYLDVKNRVIAIEELFRGTLTHTSVYPREVVKAAIRHNAACVIVSHNHPSGVADPSNADLLLTSTLTQALALVDVRLLDHIVVAGECTHSMAEHGQM